MSRLSNAKAFGGIGAILLLIGAFIPSIGFVVSIAGLVLIFVAVKYLADETKDQAIFKNYMYSFIFSVVAIVAAFAIIAATIGATLGFSEIWDWETEDPDEEEIWGFAATVCLGVGGALIVGWILMIIGTLYLRKSYNSIAKHTNVDLFRTTGTLYFIGAITLIILIGALILLIARILEIISFFSLPDQLPEAPTEAVEDVTES